MDRVDPSKKTKVPEANSMAAPTQPAGPPESNMTQDNGVIPPLENGDRLTRAEFERRYDAMPELKKAELVEGRFTSPHRSDTGGTATRIPGWLPGWGTMKQTPPGSRRAITAASAWTWITNPNPTLT